MKAEIVKPIDRINDPHAAAKAIYDANPGACDFVAVFERRGFDRYFGAFQDAWRPDEDLDVYVQRMYAMMDQYRDAIATYPGPARDMLGLQWRLGATYAEGTTAIRNFVEPGTSVVFGIFDGDALWATLVLRFDADHRADVVTTVDPSELRAAGRDAMASEVVSWVESNYGSSPTLCRPDWRRPWPEPDPAGPPRRSAASASAHPTPPEWAGASTRKDRARWRRNPDPCRRSRGWR
jgi:hypothetical protein